MGSVFSTTPSDPLWMPSITNPKFSFVTEIEMWPMVHSLLPFAITYWFQNPLFTILLFVLNEIVEGFISLFSESSQINEDWRNSALSDLYFGFIGVAIAELLLYLMTFKKNGGKRNRRLLIPPDIDLYGHFGLYVKYLFQLILILSIVLSCTVYFADGFIPLGNFIAPFWFAFWIFVASYWNKGDRSWVQKRTYVANNNTQLSAGSEIVLSDLMQLSDTELSRKMDISIQSIYQSQPNRTQRSEEEIFWAEYYFIFWVSCSAYVLTLSFRWTTTYIMVLFETTLILAIEIIALAIKWYYYIPSSKMK